MNYIQQINGFWAKSESDDLTGNDIAVYMALLKYCNSLNWLNPFVCHWEIVCQYAKVSKNTYYKSLNKLDGLNYIKYTEGKKNVLKPKIVILKFENRKGIIREQHEEQNEEQKGNLNKQETIKQETIKHRERFKPPTIEEIKNYASDKEYLNFDAEVFFNFYDSKGWMVGKSKMKNWKSAMAGWHARNKNQKNGTNQKSTNLGTHRIGTDWSEQM